MAKEVTDKAALTAFGPNNVVIAQSWDNGKTWKQTDAGKELNKVNNVKPRPFTRRVVAAVTEFTPSIARRVETPFSVMYNEGIIAGWAPPDELASYGEKSVDCIMVPELLPRDMLEELKASSKTLLMDIDAPQYWDSEKRDEMVANLDLFDGIIVPTELLAGRLRPYHSHVFVTPHLLRPDLWQGIADHEPRPVHCAIPGTLDDVLQPAIDELTKRHGERVVWVPYDWNMFPTDEPNFYSNVDVVIVPPPPDRWQGCLAPLLPAMMGKTTVVAERSWAAIQHKETGIIIPRHTTMNWLQELHRLLQDRRTRIRVGRSAKSWAARYSPLNKINQVLLPYRVMVEENSPVTYR